MKPSETVSNQASRAQGANADYLNALEAVHVEEQTPLDLAEQLLEERRFERVMRMTSTAFGRLSQVEKRNYTRWAKHLAKVFREKADLFERNSTRDPPVPAFLQAEG